MYIKIFIHIHIYSHMTTNIILWNVVLANRDKSTAPFSIFSTVYDENNYCVNCKAKLCVHLLKNPVFGTKSLIKKSELELELELEPMNIQKLKTYDPFKNLSDIELSYILDYVRDERKHNECNIRYHICPQCNSLFTSNFTKQHKLFGITYQTEHVVNQFKSH